ncbi:hypothetical protein GYA37_04220 [candidate division WWE3 bacterium]|uniref:Uncharacterized protein n=1 Tax=candidate division WWE3 bacterium TaxID=2053526 RepID=A0A7X9E7P9_UNCKA|nr:hypothetical protein [candidate division WWE3 bacterium]
MLDWFTIITEFVKSAWEEAYIPPTDVLVPTYFGWIAIAIAIISMSVLGQARDNLKIQASGKYRQKKLSEAENLKKKGITYGIALILLGIVILLLQEYVLQALFAVICFIAAAIVLCVAMGLVALLIIILINVSMGVIFLFE